ncbi:hypothetical protein K490DRAFT_58841 [Neofusicoccum parvum]|uniref:Uncharacterized protein n=1 Tax=Neofusicoccum parvum TaxID=310453 RepID=A0ACB5SCA5_9PEZI|nr:hypothetical protein K490DRAFT_58841 [Neofusicoccum parvum]
MADPFSIAASAAGIISLGLTVSSGLVRFVQTAQGAPKELETVCNDVYALCGILNIFESLQDELGRASKQIKVKTRTTKAGLLGYGGGGGEKIVLSMRERAGYFFRRGELDRVRGDLREAKMTLMLAISLAEWKGLNKMVKKAGRREEHAAERAYLLATVVSLDAQLKELQRRQHGSGAPASSNPSPGSPWAHANNTFPVTPPSSSVSGHGSTAGLFDPTPSDPDPDPYDSGHEDGIPPSRTFRAWTTTATSESTSLTALGLHCHIEAAHLPREELLAILGRPRAKEGDAGRGSAVSARLRAFNEPVRQMILRHAASLPGARLVGVEGLEDEQGRVVQSVFGDVGVVAPVWVTAHDDADAERDEEVEREVRRRLERMGIGVEVGDDMRRKAEEEKLETVKREKALRMERESLQEIAYMRKTEGKNISLRAGPEVEVVEKSYKEEKAKQSQEARLRLMEEDLAVRRKKQEVNADKLVRLKEEVKLLERRLREAEMRRDVNRAVDIRHGALPDVRFRIQEVEAEMMQDGKVLLELEGRVSEERRREGEKRKGEEKRLVHETEELYKREKSPRPPSHHTSDSIRRGGSARSSDAALQDSEPFEVTLDRDAAEALAKDLIAEWIES